MSDRDSNHTLLELQEARAEIDRLRQVTVGQFEGAASLVEQLAKLEKQLTKARKTIQALNTENDALLMVLEQAMDELTKLTGKLTRWRKWPEEKPEKGNFYLLAISDYFCQVVYFGNDGEWWNNGRKDKEWWNEFIENGITYWKPIGPLPGGE